MSPKISVIIPVYNVEKYLRECLESVINQTFKDIEIICIDDCSPDNSKDILDEYAKKDARIRIIKHDKNKGLGPARNTGIEAATGECLTFLDSDDYFELDVLEKLYKKIVKTNADFITVGYVWYDECSEKVLNNLDTIQVNKHNFNKILNNFCVVAWGKLFKTKYLKDNKLLFINNHDVHEDDGFTLKLLSTYPTYSCIPNIGVIYRKNSVSIMSTLSEAKSLQCEKHNLEDAIIYIKNNCADANFLIKTIKGSYKYCKLYSLFGKFFRFIWEKYDKHIVVLCIDIFKSKVKNDILITKFLGIKVFEKNVKAKTSSYGNEVNSNE